MVIQATWGGPCPLQIGPTLARSCPPAILLLATPITCKAFIHQHMSCDIICFAIIMAKYLMQWITYCILLIEKLWKKSKISENIQKNFFFFTFNDLKKYFCNQFKKKKKNQEFWQFVQIMKKSWKRLEVLSLSVEIIVYLTNQQEIIEHISEINPIYEVSVVFFFFF